MKNSDLYKELFRKLENDLELLPDKPEETVESTLAALWLLTAGKRLSAEKAVYEALPGLTDEQMEMLQELIDKRISGYPLAYITGRQQFMGVELIANESALIPRKETEILGNTALSILESYRNKKYSEITAFDLCCGAGNLAVALALKVPEVFIYASDLSPEAVQLAGENIKMYDLKERVRVHQGSVLDAFQEMGFEERVDLIICNPPYISDAKVPDMAEEISQYEPDMAFNGGMLGLKVVTELIRKAPAYLKKGGWLTFEVGLGQGEFVKNLCLKTQLYDHVEEVRDKNGNTRVIKARK